MDEALWLLSEEPVDAAGRVAPTAERVLVYKEEPGGRVQVMRKSGEILRLVPGKELFDVDEFPDNVPIVFEDDCGIDAGVLTAAAVFGGISVYEVLDSIDPQEALALHESCPEESMLDEQALELLKERAQTL